MTGALHRRHPRLCAPRLGRRHPTDQHADRGRSLPDSPRHRRLCGDADRGPAGRRRRRSTSCSPKRRTTATRSSMCAAPWCKHEPGLSRLRHRADLAILLVYLILMAQFTSFIDPFIILMAIPPGLAGVALILVLTGSTLNIMSLMGVIMMTGIVVSNSILIVEFSREPARTGHAAARSHGACLQECACVRSS